MESAFKFMFIPESVMSIIFLIIFLTFFAYGVWMSWDCKTEWNKFHDEGLLEYEKVKKRYHPEKFIQIFENNVLSKEEKLIDMPNAFVTIGILGTFIGLGVAIQGAADLLSDENIDIAKLNGVLGVIAFKFQISVWGTIFSLVFQKVIEEKYRDFKHGIMAKIMISLYENEKDVRTTLEEHLAVMSETKEIEDMQLKEINNMQDKFGKYIKLAADFAENVDRFGDNVEVYHRDWLKSQENLQNNAKNAANSFISAIKDMQTQFVENQIAMAEIHQQIHVDERRSLETLRKIFVRSEDEYMKSAQESFNKMLQKSLLDIKKGYTDAAEKLGNVVSNLDSSLDDVKKAAEVMRENSENSQNILGNVLQQTMEINKDHQEKIEYCYEQLFNQWKDMKYDAEKQREYLMSVLQEIYKGLGDLTSQLENKSNDLKPYIEDYKNKMNQEVKLHNRRLKEIDGKIDKMIMEICATHEFMKDMPNQIAKKGVEALLSYPVKKTENRHES